MIKYRNLLMLVQFKTCWTSGITFMTRHISCNTITNTFLNSAYTLNLKYNNAIINKTILTNIIIQSWIKCTFSYPKLCTCVFLIPYMFCYSFRRNKSHQVLILATWVMMCWFLGVKLWPIPVAPTHSPNVLSGSPGLIIMIRLILCSAHAVLRVRGV